MGTDIHFYTERRTATGWESADNWTPYPYKDDEEGGPDEWVSWDDQLYTSRNYDVFAILADVRNGRGFAGIDTGDGFVPIAEERGLPDDLSPRLKTFFDAHGVDHTPSWLTLAELLAYDWTQRTKKRGVVGPSEWAVFREQGEPRSYSGDVQGGGVRHFTPERFEEVWQQVRAEFSLPEQRWASHHLKGGSWGEPEVSPELRRFREIIGSDQPYCRVEWEVPYYRAARDFFGTVIPQLLRLGAPDDVRIVFYFDS
jgi:hypothetical protein